MTNKDKLCECGCGSFAPIAKASNKKLGYIKGEPVRFVRGHNPAVRQDARTRFWRKVKRGGLDECWEWSGAIGGSGYGYFHSSGSKLAHRFSWELHNSEIPQGKIVCHTCDNKICVNPNHLFIGSQKDNMVDMIEKGRGGQKGRRNMPSGENHGNAILSNQEVKNIREEFSDLDISISAYAKIIGVNRRTLSGIINRKTYKNI